MSSALSGLGNLMGAIKTNQGLEGARGDISGGYRQAINQLRQLLPQFQHFNFQQDPGYQFALEQGQQGINNAANARGNWFAPSTMNELNRYNTGMANQTYNDAFNRWMGQNTNQLGLANSLGNMFVGRGNAMAGNTMAQGQNASNMWTSSANMLAQMAGGMPNMGGIMSMFGGGGGGAGGAVGAGEGTGMGGFGGTGAGSFATQFLPALF